MSAVIESFENDHHRAAVIALWDAVFAYESPHNRPALSIDKKLAVDDGLFFVATHGAAVVGTIMAGYDGHRGWIYSLAVAPPHRQQGLGRRLVRHAEGELIARGCMKVNLQIRSGNEAVAEFYQSLGFLVEGTLSMGKIIPENVPPP
jgi:ribosomal protein S18 acetylase RimI-like enzyme